MVRKRRTVTVHDEPWSVKKSSMCQLIILTHLLSIRGFDMTCDEEASNRFFEPWKYANELGIPEIEEQEFEVLKPLGSGKKSSASLATWNGRSIALKSWRADNSNYSDAPAYSYWELMCYCNLKDAQGSLVPELLFVSRQKDTGTLVLGLELGEPVSGYEEGFRDAKKKLRTDLEKEGWIQRSGSFRDDNLVWMQNEDNSKRLVAIDLESFIPYFGVEREERLHASKRNMTIFGLPEISPSELQLDNCDTSLEWTTYGRNCTGTWRKQKKVTVMPYYKDRKTLETELERYELFKKEQGTLIPRPLCLARERNGTILLVLEHFETRCCNININILKRIEEIRGPLAKLGWDLSSSSLGSLGTGEQSRPVLYDLAHLEEIEPVPVAIDKSGEIFSGSSPPSAKKQKIHTIQPLTPTSSPPLN